MGKKGKGGVKEAKEEPEEEGQVEAPVEPTTGEDKFVYPNGTDKYEGGWILADDGASKQRHGRGVQTLGPERYEGEFQFDRMEGAGKMVFASGATYVGVFADGRFHGDGMYTWADGATYTGGWQQNKMHGQGTYCDKDGQEWSGPFYNGKLNDGESHIVLRDTT